MDKTTLAGPHTPETFARWLKGQLVAAGYHMTIRGGGQKTFAEKAGISRSTLSRILRGEAGPDPETLRAIADALGRTVSEVYIRAGLLSYADLASLGPGSARPEGAAPLTPETAADELGITDQPSRDIFVNMVHTLARHRRQRGQEAAEQ